MQALFEQGFNREEIFERFIGRDLPEKRVASLVASLKDDTLCQLYSGRNNFLISVMFVHSIAAAFIGYIAGSDMEGQAPLWLAGIAALIPLLFMFGFYKYNLGAYLAFVFLSLTQMPRSFEGFNDAPVVVASGLLITIGTVVLVWHVKSKLYPYFGVFGAKQQGGRFDFSS
ncbi:hypothetical protein MDG893_15992 [Marinobacter algicola DG893]|uniref:Uncharacterized protein n=2 Tax=Marinobacter algicola TaxID=236100 RepID=A6F2L3_9GAMM|nr:hypothetical protein MDG893_15992 [Marinobacter algicola DG893]